MSMTDIGFTVTGFPLALAVALSGCGPSIVGEASTPFSTVGDQADRSCQVVLTSVAPRELGTPGNYMTDCDLDGTTVCRGRLVWFAEVQLAPSVAQQSGAPALLYRSTDDPSAWVETPAAGSTLSSDGSLRFEARMIALHPGPDDGTQGAELIPFARFPNGGRLFDHNEYRGPFENYRIGTPPAGAISDTASPGAMRWRYDRSSPCGS